jgi:hypothetical protein
MTNVVMKQLSKSEYWIWVSYYYNTCTCILHYFVLWPTNAQLIDKLSHSSYMFRQYCVIFRDFVVSTLPRYTSMSNAVAGTMYIPGQQDNSIYIQTVYTAIYIDCIYNHLHRDCIYSHLHRDCIYSHLHADCIYSHLNTDCIYSHKGRLYIQPSTYRLYIEPST